ncbi:hypothetical protein RI138_22330 [Streptomyces sp. C11-1]|uniref:Uncharacterized protein n=1 Tax=Streptomyces durocortorensis TaxID=2811104 RepID=A0ABY9W0K8_9ACTN|nr:MULTISPECIES: hypothetical protein [Streptomyces]WNF29340.1 hypothetical protein RI138_22330 [Streptomyces durocortorensis]
MRKPRTSVARALAGTALLLLLPLLAAMGAEQNTGDLPWTEVRAHVTTADDDLPWT